MSINKEINTVILICLSVFLVISVLVSMYSLNSLKNQEVESHPRDPAGRTPVAAAGRGAERPFRGCIRQFL